MIHEANALLRIAAGLLVALLSLVVPVSMHADCVLACDRVSLIWAKDRRSTEPLFRVVNGKKIGYIDAKGRLKIPFRFDVDYNHDWDFVEGLAPVQSGRDWGFIDAEGD
ncbi:MAG: WG repeat-containing protein, partial [Terriglobales bacterium]